jgi:hypothetical protein
MTLSKADAESSGTVSVETVFHPETVLQGRTLTDPVEVQRLRIAPVSMSFHFQGSWPVPGNVSVFF